MIKRVHIRNFKSLRDVTVDLDPLTVLIGRSGSGKTNFVHALRWLRDALRYRDAGRANQGLSWEQILSAMAGYPCHLTFRLHFSIPAFAEELEYNLSYFFNQQGAVNLHEEWLALNNSTHNRQQSSS